MTLAPSRRAYMQKIGGLLSHCWTVCLLHAVFLIYSVMFLRVFVRISFFIFSWDSPFSWHRWLITLDSVFMIFRKRNFQPVQFIVNPSLLLQQKKNGVWCCAFTKSAVNVTFHLLLRQAAENPPPALCVPPHKDRLVPSDSLATKWPKSHGWWMSVWLTGH